MKLPEPPKENKAEATLVLPPPPPPRPKAHKDPPPKPHEAERKKPIDPDKPKQRQTTAPPSTLAMRSNAAAAPAAGSGAAPSASPATWKSVLMAHLNRYKRYPPGAATTGTASVAFTIARSGQVLSTRLIGSFGDQALDAEAVSLPRRREPRPCPAAGFRRRRSHSHRPHPFRRVKDHLSNTILLIDCPSLQPQLGRTDATQALENWSLQRRVTKRPRQAERLHRRTQNLA